MTAKVTVCLDPMPVASYVLEADGSVWPVTCMFDEDGVETSDISEACLVNAGHGDYHITVALGDVRVAQ